MRTRLAPIIGLALFAALLAFPAGMSGKERRGAEIVVTRLDGSRVGGELIAVRPDSLLLLSQEAGREFSVGLAEIRSVVIIRKSKGGLLAGIGGAAGAAAGATFGAYVFNGGSDDEPSSLRNGLIFGAAGALAGLLANSVLTRDPHFNVAGKPEEDVARFWERLSAHSREGARPKIAPAAAPARAPVPARPGRFRLSVSASIPLSIAETWFDEFSTFSFPDQAAPESGPYDCALIGNSSSGPVRFGLGPVALAYEWTPHVSVDAELSTSGQSSGRWNGALGFTSSIDGVWYTTYFVHGYDVRFSSFLLGLSYHPFVRDSLQPHDIEIGAAAGPVWIKGAPVGAESAGPFTLPSVGKIGFAGRVQAAYDFRFTPALSLGLFAGYRLMETRLAGITASGVAAYLESGDPTPTVAFSRLTEVSLPPLTVRATGPFAGLRIAFRI